MHKIFNSRFFMLGFCMAVFILASGFDLGAPKLPAKIETVKFTLKDASDAYGLFGGTDLDPYKGKSAETIKTGKANYDQFFADSRKLLMTHEFAKRVVEQANAQKAAGQVPVQPAAAAAAIGVTYNTIENRALGLADQAQSLGTSAKTDFTGADASNAVKVAGATADLANELRKVIEEAPQLLPQLAELAQVK